MDCARGWRRRSSHAIGNATRQYQCAVLWKCETAICWLVLGYEAADRFPLSQEAERMSYEFLNGARIADETSPKSPKTGFPESGNLGLQPVFQGL